MLEIRHLEKSFGDVMPLRDVNAIVEDGDCICIIGPSGCGKSTLIHCLNMLNPPTAGSIVLDGQDITAHGIDVCAIRKKLGTVFQHYNLFGHLSVIENLMMPMVDLCGLSRQAAYDRAMDLLGKVGLADKALVYPASLSGGQRQRVAIVRALCMEPSILLMDEPTSALDPNSVAEVENLLEGLSEHNVTMLIVTHDMNLARSLGNKVWYLDQGILYEEGSPEQIFEHPQHSRTRQFVMRRKTFTVQITDTTDVIKGVDGIWHFTTSNGLSKQAGYGLSIVLAELVGSLLLPLVEEGPITFTAELDKEGSDFFITIDYKGAVFDPEALDTSDKLATMRLVDRVASDLQVEHQGNQVRVTTVAGKQGVENHA